MGECAKRGLEIGSFRCQVNRERLEGIIERTIECSIGAQGYYEFLESRTMNGGRRRRAREDSEYAYGLPRRASEDEANSPSVVAPDKRKTREEADKGIVIVG